MMRAASVSLLCHSHAFLAKTQVQGVWITCLPNQNIHSLGGSLLYLRSPCARPCASLSPFLCAPLPFPPLLAPVSPSLLFTCEPHIIINLPTFSSSFFPFPLLPPFSITLIKYSQLHCGPKKWLPIILSNFL